MMPLRMPAEWEPQDWIWIGFPHDPAEWGSSFADAQLQIAQFGSAVAESGQEVRLVVRDEANEARARELASAAVTLERHAYGDIWLRDTGPLTLLDGAGGRMARCFDFNGWGGKFDMPGDHEIGAALAATAGLAHDRRNWILEGGSIDTDGTGLVVTTEQCLLNPNRNPQLSRAEIEARLRSDLGFERVLWLGQGLHGDHTDGHVDNLARFVAPGVLAIPLPASPDDPNAGVYADARARASSFGLAIADVPSPGLLGHADDAEPASYMNFAICNRVVAVPTYGAQHDADAVAAIGALFPGREAIGIPASAVLLGGGGSLHCASQQVPARS